MINNNNYNILQKLTSISHLIRDCVIMTWNVIKSIVKEIASILPNFSLSNVFKYGICIISLSKLISLDNYNVIFNPSQVAYASSLIAIVVSLLDELKIYINTFRDDIKEIIGLSSYNSILLSQIENNKEVNNSLIESYTTEINQYRDQVNDLNQSLLNKQSEIGELKAINAKLLVSSDNKSWFNMLLSLASLISHFVKVGNGDFSSSDRELLKTMLLMLSELIKLNTSSSNQPVVDVHDIASGGFER